MKKLLIIAYYFPPSQASGVFRTLAFVRHLLAKGWDIAVLTLQHPNDLNNGMPGSPLPDGVQVVQARERDLFLLWKKIKRAGSSRSVHSDGNPGLRISGRDDRLKLQGKLSFAKNQLTALLKTPDNQAGWFLSAYLQGRKLPQPDIIYSSAPPFTGHVLGAFLKKKWKVPLVLDFRDPWGGNPFRVSYGGFVERWDRYLERWVCCQSDRIIANTESMAAMIGRRFPALRETISVITNGYDPEEFEDIVPLREFSEDRLLFVHPGVLYGQRNPLPFLRAVQEAVHSKGLQEILVLFIGQHESFEGKDLETHIADLELEEHVRLMPAMAHSRVLSIMKGADQLLLLALGTTLQIPAKLFEYMGIGKPVFAVCEEASATLEVMRKMGSGHCWMLNDRQDILRSLCRVYDRWRNNGQVDCGQEVELHDHPFLRENLATELHYLLIEACRKKEEKS